MEHLILQCRPKFASRAISLLLLLCGIVLSGESALAGCPYPSAELPKELPPLPDGTCAISPNNSLPQQPVLQNYAVALDHNLDFLSVYRQQLQQRGWQLGQIKTSESKHGAMQNFDATMNRSLRLRMMVHGQGHHSHHGRETHFTVAVQRLDP